MAISKEIYQGIKKDLELMDEWCALRHKMGCIEADHKAEYQRIAQLIARKTQIKALPAAWWLCGEPQGEMLEVDTYHDAEHRTFYFLVERDAYPAVGEEWIAYEYYPELKELHQSYESRQQSKDNTGKFEGLFELLKENFGWLFFIVLGFFVWLRWFIGSLL